MKALKNPSIDEAIAALKRPAIEKADLDEVVKEVFDKVKTLGDEALREYSKQFDKVDISDFSVDRSSAQKALDSIDADLRRAMELAKSNIERFHAAQKTGIIEVETMPGVKCWRKSVGIDAVGIYIPGGTAPLFSTVLMLAVPAKLAGCGRVVMVTPPNPNDAILAAAALCDVDEIYTVGGIQAIAALTEGTQSIAPVSKIFGPGNQYVTAAKQEAQSRGVAIDMPAGPSEVLVIADDSANPAYVAADLLSQAEHGADSQVVMLTWSEELLDKVTTEVDRQLLDLPRKDVAAMALMNSIAIVVKDAAQAIRISNIYAPEHLIINTESALELSEQITNAGSVFIGQLTPESAGDYASGTNHTLPTNGYARAYSGVSLDSFVKKITYQQITPEGLANIGDAVVTMAEAEELEAHANAVRLRLSEATPRPKAVGRSPKCRANVEALMPYTSARDEFTGEGKVMLDANENPFDTGFNRYPDPYQWELKGMISEVKGVAEEKIFLGNGSDEVIDLLIRAYCEPRRDNILTFVPTYGMYKVSAGIQDIEVRTVPLNSDFSVDVNGLIASVDGNTKLIFICSPNNPTGNLIPVDVTREIATQFDGIVVVDEAYIDFAPEGSAVDLIEELENVVVMQTFSKAWGLAGIRLGMCFAGEKVVSILNKIKPPYNVNELTQNAAKKALSERQLAEKRVNMILEQRNRLEKELSKIDRVQNIFPSDANFLLVRFDDPKLVYSKLAEQGIVVRDRSDQPGCEGCLRISVGTENENRELLAAIAEI